MLTLFDDERAIKTNFQKESAQLNLAVASLLYMLDQHVAEQSVMFVDHEELETSATQAQTMTTNTSIALSAISELVREIEGGMKVLHLSAADAQAKHDEVAALNAQLSTRSTQLDVLNEVYTEMKNAVEALRARFA